MNTKPAVYQIEFDHIVNKSDVMVLPILIRNKWQAVWIIKNPRDNEIIASRIRRKDLCSHQICKARNW